MPKKTPKLAKDPLWYKDAIIYELHVKSFFDSNDDGVGDFPGLVQKLEYLQDLGVNCIWLLPFYPSPLRDDGYDIADYRGVHPSYGTRREFLHFVHEAHRRGIRVIIELVINHTSDQHPWFQAARKAAKGSAKRNFYVWSDSDTQYKDARIIFKDYEKSNWTWDAVAQQYYWHRFFHHQPDLNFDNPLVRRAIMKVMRFWLDMGVDGLRLDAIPYLIEREGTSCENLAEGHEILKAMRKELDAAYSDRMFLAEANQWPADVRPYFGDGDECHMAFHFPLMPRIFMALRQEDRHPITEILNQTPAIPDNCQWAIFLRNHDELTLEMVTDQERDYMYHEYASDPLMRLNLGIRRRLAPLLGNSRRRLELLMSLLFSFPGTPVIYYGDEIGMGDNYYLGDRNGVRTPMQWSSDRNGGFSGADFARLYAPPIMDSVYSFQTVNVEAQQRDPSSLLNWTKRMIALSKRFKTFGRGTLRFLRPANRKVLAYVREFEDETFLAVANLSRFVQPVELSLQEFKGWVPVEMLGRVEFPEVGEAPYFLTLGPHSFYWFQLQRVAPKIALEPLKAPPAKEPDDLPVLAVEGDVNALFSPSNRKLLEEKHLPAFLLRQRWYGHKSESIESVSLRDWVRLHDDPPGFLCVVDVRLKSKKNATYLVPVSLATGAGADELAKSRPTAVLARLRCNGENGCLVDGAMDDGLCLSLFDTIRNGSNLLSGGGQWRPVMIAQQRGQMAPSSDDRSVSRLNAEQSNNSFRLGRSMIVKLYRQLQDGVNPDFEVSRYLTEQAGFDRASTVFGGLEYTSRDKSRYTIAMIQRWTQNQGDGWSHTLDELARYFERAAGRPSDFLNADGLPSITSNVAEHPTAALAKETLGSSLYAAGLLGRRTAELHQALARHSADPAFEAEALTVSEQMRLQNKTRAEFERVMGILEKQTGRLPDPQQAKIDRLLNTRDALRPAFTEKDFQRVENGKIRCHGDYHLGQVLWSNNDFVILDFEGEPGRSMAERRTKQSPLKDVAGMIRSFHYAAYAALSKATADRPAEFTTLEPAARFWYAWTSMSFVAEYRRVAQEGRFIPDNDRAFESLLETFVLEKALYEILYELNNRPAWIGIPLEGIASLTTPPAQLLGAKH